MRIWITVLLTLLINILCIPLWTECDYVGFVRTFFNEEACLDLIYSGELTKDAPFRYKVTPEPLYESLRYGAGNNGYQTNLSLRAIKEWQRTSLKLNIQRDGKITILFRGPKTYDEYGFPYSVLTDWRNVKINSKTILQKDGAFSFKENFAKQLSVKKGDTFYIEAEFRKHHFGIRDFTLLNSGKVWYIITGNLLVFFLIYRLLSYIRGGGIRGGDALLLAIFFTILFIPTIGISDAVKSVRESRTLAVKPELEDIFKEKSDYGRKYEQWFNDRFCGRVPLMKLHDTLRNKLSHIIRTKNAIYFKESGWEFHLPLVYDLDSRPSFVQSIVQNLVQLNEFCQQNQIKLYVLEVPKKEIVYKRLIKANYGFDEKKLAKVSQTQEFIRNEARKHLIPYIYPYEVLRDAAKQDFVFFKWTHHWTDWGAYVGYRELMEEITKDFPNMPVVSLDDFQKSQNWLIRDKYDESLEFASTWRQFYQFFNYGDVPPNRALYSYYDHNNRARMTLKFGMFTKEFSYSEGRHRVMLVGTSQNDNLNHFLPYSAAQLKYIRVNLGKVKREDELKILKLYKRDISDFKPDILILSISSENLPQLRNLCSTK